MVLIFSILLMSGITAGQVFDCPWGREAIALITSVCLAYIMIEVGLEFSVDKREMKSYGWDAVVASVAAILPVVLWFFYFMFILQGPWRPALLAGLSAAPTSAGVLFTMMMAAGLSATWVFKKARTLAVLDDLVTILLLTPLQIIIHGFEWRSVVVLVLIMLFLFVAFRWQNSVHWPFGQMWLLGYAVILTALVFLIRNKMDIHLEVLVPAFMWGCLARLPSQKHSPAPPAQSLGLDTIVKGLFMFLVGFSFPKISLGSVPWQTTFGHVLILTLLSNLGKSFTVLCYRRKISLRERWALSFAMFPRGEVGAAVLLIGLGYGFGGYVSNLVMLSLALNLVLTGIFIWIVIKLLNQNERASCVKS